MNLYTLTEKYIQLSDDLDNPEIQIEQGEFIAREFLQTDEDIEEKLENYVKLMKNTEADAEAYKKEEERLCKLRKVAENKALYLKTCVENAMKLTGKSKIKGRLFNLSIQKNPPGVCVLNESKIPDEFFIEQKPLLDKKSLLKRLKDGEFIDGAKLEQSETLRIK